MLATILFGNPALPPELGLQQGAFAEAGCGKIFIERLSGAVTDRPALRKALEFARSGNTLMANPDMDFPPGAGGFANEPRHPRREGWRRGEPDGASRGSSRRRQ